MKVLIAYEGSECSDAAIVDLRRAGLPDSGEALVLSVAEILPELAVAPYGAMVPGPGMYVPPSVDEALAGGRQLADAESLANQAADRFRADFPGWHVTTEAWVDAPAAAIIRKVRAWQPDLLVVGSHGWTGIKRLVLGSVSEHILHHSDCSVRISRHRLHSQERPIRLVVGVDGSDNARIAVQAIAARAWPAGTEARVVGVLDSRIPLAAAGTLEGAIPVAIEEEFISRMTTAVDDAAADLTKAGLNAAPLVPTGDPSEVLLAEAEKWSADSIFVGARGLNAVERLLLGSVSLAVASKAHCSVEVVRARKLKG
jgi:nucleotide-binding universal stress UspA family protein